MTLFCWVLFKQRMESQSLVFICFQCMIFIVKFCSGFDYFFFAKFLSNVTMQIFLFISKASFYPLKRVVRYVYELNAFSQKGSAISPLSQYSIHLNKCPTYRQLLLPLSRATPGHSISPGLYWQKLSSDAWSVANVKWFGGTVQFPVSYCPHQKCHQSWNPEKRRQGLKD